ncbi:cilia- and flagella-associated protein 97-like [Dendronephthya gigantea]|uniref:cilia- and flagella-associated protein 97-like n=1 Tax=Dendronephthya gigantea TaxID=151771 RepID=UPI00106C39DE|nr:cilia- and flagella-associated protein 97-like [Dendronephthya gigantea]
MASSRKREGKERISQNSDENGGELHGTSKEIKETGDRLQREHFLKPDSDQIDLNLLLDAVLDINDKLRTQEQDPSSYAGMPRKYTGDCDSVCKSHSSKKQFHLTQEIPKRSENRRNFSFRNEQVLAIDMENQRLLREISRPRPCSAVSTRKEKFKNIVHEPVRIKTSSEVNRKRFQRRIDEENQALLRRLEAVKPTKGLNREHLLRSETSKKNRSRPSSACSSPGRLSTRTGLVTGHNFDQRDDGSVHSDKSFRKTYAKPEWEAGW